MRSSLLALSGMIGLFLVGSLVTVNADEKTEKQLKRIEGDYALVSGEEKGESLSEETVKTASLKIEGDKHVVKIGDVTIEGTHSLDPAQKPKAIDSMETEGPHKGKTVLGIYKFQKGEFTVCFAPPGEDRPKKFTTKSGTGEILHVWKKK